tara:strand:+ start:81 stop:185 length:105 start_codon:yes stop_codon:yes gene_type:complete
MCARLPVWGRKIKINNKKPPEFLGGSRKFWSSLT